MILRTGCIAITLHSCRAENFVRLTVKVYACRLQRFHMTRHPEICCQSQHGSQAKYTRESKGNAPTNDKVRQEIDEPCREQEQDHAKNGGNVPEPERRVYEPWMCHATLVHEAREHAYCHAADEL